MKLSLILVAAIAVMSAACGSGPAAAVSTPSASPSAAGTPSTTPSAVVSPTAKQSPSPASSPSAPVSPCEAEVSPPPTSAWLRYSDAGYGFSISYPPAFEVDGHTSPSDSEIRALYRVVDKCLQQFPPGQIELGVFTYDANSLTAWVQKHSDVDCAGSNTSAFIFGVSNMHSVTVAGRAALTFDDKFSGCGGPAGSGQETVFLLSPNYVFMLGWWAARSAYAPTISAVASKMLGTFTG